MYDMSSKFNGFTQDEICTINSKPDQAKKPNGGTVRKHTVRRTNSANAKHAEIAANKSVQSKAMPETASAELSDSTIQAFHEAMHFRPLNGPSPSAQPADAEQVNGNESLGRPPSRSSAGNDYNGNVDSGQAATFNGISLKDFEKHQKVLKEANLEKRRLLSQAIEQRFEQSIAEAAKIAKIRDELDKLDQELAVDVEILRKEIEAVSLQYTNTKENYHQIESQFLAAKLDLHHITEKKELLTEHLCTIISHNENRKAKKLSELLDKVGLSADDDLADGHSPVPSDRSDGGGLTINDN